MSRNNQSIKSQKISKAILFPTKKPNIDNS
jgi:hypothetical protein